MNSDKGTNTAPLRTGMLKAGLLLLAALAPLKAEAEQRSVTVVELFTSQGCSACPPADELFVELSEREDLVTLSYHVDYWDYLGWKDDLATPENTARQRAYSQAFEKAFYTPQIIVDGVSQFVGSHREEIEGAIREASRDPLSVDVVLASSDGSVFVDIGAAPPGRRGIPAARRGAHVILVSYEPQKVVRIGGGDNKGRTIDYRNVVTSYQTVGMWQGKALRIELPMSEMRKKGGHSAILVQVFDKQGRPGRILGAARTDDRNW